MKCLLVLLACVFTFADMGMARIGESIPQCTQRYGEAVTNFPGLGAVTAVNQYEKDDVTITIWFVRTVYRDARAAMVLYSPAPPDSSAMYTIRQMSEDESNALLKTAPGQWEPYKQPEKLTGRPAKVIAISSSPSLIETRRDQVRAILKNAIDALYPNGIFSGVEYWIKDIGHNGTQLYCFEALKGISIVSFDESPAIAKWANSRIAKRDGNRAQKTSEMDGF